MRLLKICLLNLQEYTFKFSYAKGGQVGMGISLNGRGSSKGDADQVGRGHPNAQAVSFKAGPTCPEPPANIFVMPAEFKQQHQVPGMLSQCCHLPCSRSATSNTSYAGVQAVEDAGADLHHAG